MSGTTAAGMPLRSYRLHRYVTAFCPHCHAQDPSAPLESVARLSGYLVEEEGRIWLVRACRTHGRVVTLYDENPEILRYLEEWTAPTKAHVPDRPGNFAPVPEAYLSGLPEMQTQHTCILLEDVVQGCNLRCPTCFSESSPDQAGVVPVAHVMANVDARLARENGRLERRHGLWWRAHRAPRPHHDPQRTRRSSRQPDPAEHQWHPDRAG